jgi:cellulose synthase/poly-beta-1,6-N-acetylglucosamine synthase-like glycosyltransferase
MHSVKLLLLSLDTRSGRTLFIHPVSECWCGGLHTISLDIIDPNNSSAFTTKDPSPEPFLLVRSRLRASDVQGLKTILELLSIYLSIYLSIHPSIHPFFFLFFFFWFLVFGFWFFETGFLCITLAVLELTL